MWHLPDCRRYINYRLVTKGKYTRHSLFRIHMPGYREVDQAEALIKGDRSGIGLDTGEYPRSRLAIRDLQA
jgi:hypothetical protein